ncbi:MAG: hypothetical protein N3F66_14850, partial [Spirochaetes bacterium]|nr:hypothetical protein [Spirochaetota bacterium]
MSKIKEALLRAKSERSQTNDMSLFKRPPVFQESQHQTKVIDYSEVAVVRNKIITPYFDNPELTNQLKLLRTKILQETQKFDDRTILVTST